MNTYKGKNVVATVSSIVFALLGITIFILSKGTVSNIIGIAFIILSIIGIANYFKYSISLDADELKITTVFKGRKIKYRDIISIFSVQAGRTSVTYIIDRYKENGKWFVRGTYPPCSVEQLKEAKFNSLNDVVSINSYSFPKYKEILAGISKKIPVNCNIDPETWRIINS